MRILLVDLEPTWRGGQEQAFTLLRGLLARGHEPELLSIPGSALGARTARAGIPVHTTGRAMRGLGASRAVRRLLRDGCFDIVHTNHAHELTAAWLARVHRRVPLVASRRAVYPLSASRVARARYRAASMIIAISQAVREQLLAAGLDRGRIAVVSSGIEIPERLSTEEKIRARRNWGIGAHERVAAYVAALTAEKGHGLLLDAFGEVRRRVPGCRLLLAGEGPLRAQLQQKAEAQGLLPAVIFAGFIEEIRTVYAACDIFLFSSLQEALGSSLLRAIAFALPAAAVAGGGIGEAIEDGRTGLLVREATAGALADAATRLFTEPELGRRLGEAGREAIRAHFSVERMVDETLRIYAKLTGLREPA